MLAREEHFVGVQALQGSLLQAVAERLAGRGFTRRGQSFERAVPIGKHLLHLSLIPYPAGFGCMPSLGVRHDLIEDLVNKFAPHLPQREKRYTYTVGSPIAVLSGEGYAEWQIADEADGARAVDEQLARFERYGVPYFERYSVLADVLGLLRDPTLGPVHSPFPGGRAKRIVAAAYLLGDREMFEREASAYADLLRREADLELPQFLALVASLREQAGWAWTSTLAP